MLELAHEVHNTTLLVTVAGELDLETAPRLRATIDGELSRSGAENLLLDMSGVSFLDSSGLGAILGRYRAVHAAGGKMAIAGAQTAVKRVLRLSGIAQIIAMYASKDTGLKALARRRRGRAAKRARDREPGSSSGVAGDGFSLG